MANDQGAGLGLFPISQPYGNIKLSVYKASTGKAIYRYQPVALDGLGRIIVADIADLTPILGVAVGFLGTEAGGLPSGMTSLTQGAFLPASTDGFVICTDDPDQEYMLEADTGGGTLPDLGTFVFKTANFTYEATTGNTTTGIANVRLDISELAADSGGSLTVLRPARNINSDGSVNATSANFCKLIVKLTKPQASAGVLSATT